MFQISFIIFKNHQGKTETDEAMDEKKKKKSLSKKVIYEKETTAYTAWLVAKLGAHFHGTKLTFTFYFYHQKVYNNIQISTYIKFYYYFQRVQNCK